MTPIQDTWFAFLVDVELAKHYNQVDVRSRSLAPNPVLDALLPSLLYVKLGALADESFDYFISQSGLPVPKSYRGDFNGRINFLTDQGLLKDSVRIHALRIKRNELAHEAAKSCTWKELDEATTDTENELQHLGLVGPPPKFEFFAQRRPRDKADPGCMISFDYSYGLKVDGIRRVEVSWQQNLRFPGQ